MANIVSTEMYVEGPREDLQRLHDKLLPGVEDYYAKIPFGELFFGNFRDLYFTEEGALHFVDPDFPWRESPLTELIPQEFPSLSVYYLALMECGQEGACTNDDEKKYFDFDEICRILEDEEKERLSWLSPKATEGETDSDDLPF